MSLEALVAELRASRGFAHKRDIEGALTQLAPAFAAGIAVGDDCAAIPDGQGGHLLFAIEGFVEDFVCTMPWFAGWCGVMVNLSDIAAMGGRATAVVDAQWATDATSAAPVLAGLAAACQAYGVPLVGGHSNHRAAQANLAVAVLGRAQKLLTSFDARPGDALVMAVDLRGAFEEPHPFWNATRGAPPARLRDDLALLPALAEDGLADAAKDISMAGTLGSTLMLLEGSRVGAVVDLAAIPTPPGVPRSRWLQAFPSFGFVLSVRPQQAAAVLARFHARDIAAAAIGTVTAEPQFWLRDGDDRALLWDVAAEPFIAPVA
jgi:uncharacterized protein